MAEKLENRKNINAPFRDTLCSWNANFSIFWARVIGASGVEMFQEHSVSPNGALMFFLFSSFSAIFFRFIFHYHGNKVTSEIFSTDVTRRYKKTTHVRKLQPPPQEEKNHHHPQVGGGSSPS